MPTLALYLVRKASAATLAVLLVLGPLLFLTLLASDRGQAEALLALRPWLAGETALVLSAPILFALAAAGGLALLHARLHESGENLALALGTVSPWWVMGWTLMPALLLSLASLGLMVEAHPAAARTLRGTAWIQSELVPALLEERSGSERFDHLAFSGRALGEGRVEDLALVVEDSRGGLVALGASRASFDLAQEGILAIEMIDGVVTTEGADEGSVRFGEARVEVNLRSLVHTGHGSWLKADSRPIARLAGDARQARKVAGEEARRSANRYAFEPFYRLLLGLLPLLVALQLSVSLCWLSPLENRTLPSLAAFLLISLLSAWMISLARSFAGDSPRTALTLLACSAVVPGAVVWLALRGRRWRC
jgi:lipopolysaccharide export LptBFGC system permease protein LptF